jgi:DNA-binding NarL/FixJ family response regulator
MKGLTSRQLDVLRGVARGLTDKEIASELSLSPRTVEMHVARMLDALGCANRAEAVRKAAALGLLD